MKSKVIIVSLCLVFSSSALSSSNIWSNDGIDSNISPEIKVTLFQNVSGGVNIGLTFPSDDCVDFEDRVLKAPSYSINGTLVKSYAQCIGKGKRMDFPATDAGKEYVISQFKQKNTVVYGQDGFEITFSAIGFSAVYENYKNRMDGI
ncbi:hypothetical protein M2G90_20440 [Vibrio vulnificus]|uniref:hypothetical protein n=1 Tax=Vibrio vulnificus TaxID=672 RepID=UPI0010238270|nr:hypothetical protein [Vibrio vulnificus]MCU8247206.1 hypothetical protein [Vibrio vulnificus]